MERSRTEIPEADGLDQARPAADDEPELGEVSDAAEVPEADAREQAEPALLDEDAERR